MIDQRHYLATAISVARPFLHGANTPQYSVCQLKRHMGICSEVTDHLFVSSVVSPFEMFPFMMKNAETFLLHVPLRDILVTLSGVLTFLRGSGVDNVHSTYFI
jgi:hypothetical protein